MTDTDRRTIWLAEGQRSRVEEIVSTGHYMNRADVVRDGLRRLVRQPRKFKKYDGVLEDKRSPRGRANINRKRLTFRAPIALLESAEDLNSGSISPVVRAGIELVADDFLEVTA